MMEKEIEVNINWLDDEIISINCPYCKRELTVTIYRDSLTECECGKKFTMSQKITVYEVLDEKTR